MLDRVLDDRFLVNSSKGPPRDKTSAIADTLGWNMLSQTITERTVLVDGDTAIVFGTANFRFAVEGKNDDISSGRYTTAYIKRDGRWRALALQMTALGTAALAGPPAESGATGNTGGDEAAVLAAMDRYLTAISASDLDAMASLQTPDGMTYRARAEKDGGTRRLPRPEAVGRGQHSSCGMNQARRAQRITTATSPSAATLQAHIAANHARRVHIDGPTSVFISGSRPRC